MKNRIIPTLFALNKKEFDKKLVKLSFLHELHIDLMDGKFVDNKSVNIKSINKISEYKDIDFQIHLMVEKPEQYFDEIKKYSNIKTVFLHIESFFHSSDLESCINKYKDSGFKVGFVLNPDTNIKEIIMYLNEIDSIMLMSVYPGAEGQKFIINVLDKARELRKYGFLSDIQIDGGISDKTIVASKLAGLNVFCVGSYVSRGDDVKEKYERLFELIR